MNAADRSNLMLRDADIFIPRRALLSDPGVVPTSPYIGVDALSRSQRRWSRYWLQPRTTMVPYELGLHGLSGLSGAGCCGAVPGTPFPALSGCCASCEAGGPCGGGVGGFQLADAKPYILPTVVGGGLGFLLRGTRTGTVIGALLGAGAYWAYNQVATAISSAMSQIVHSTAEGLRMERNGALPPTSVPAPRLPGGRVLRLPDRPVAGLGLSGFFSDLTGVPQNGEAPERAQGRAQLRYVQLGVALSAAALLFEVTRKRKTPGAVLVSNRGRRKNSGWREGTRVRYTPGAVDYYIDRSAAKGRPHPKVDDLGTVRAIPIGRGKATRIGGPGGGLVYVEWDTTGVQGVSPASLTRIKSKRKR